MAAELKPYPAYKDSGVPWLGDVPVQWEVRRLAQIGKLSKGSGGSKDDEVSTGIPCIRYGDLYTTHNYFIRKSRSFIPKGKIPEYTAIKFGDVLFAGSGETIDEIGKSAVNLMQKEACCGGDVILFRPARQIEPRYLGYATDCRPAAAQKAIMGRGITVMHIYGTQLKYLALPLPPLPEQTAIVRFLDHADRRIRRYIRAKQKLITLLEEQKQAIIHQAVTGQIDIRTGQPYPSYKPSGVEWLGEVPAHWEVVALRRKWQVIDCKHLTVPFVDGGIPLASVREAQSFELNFKTSNRTTPEWYEKLIEGGREPRPGDLIYCRNVSVGAAALVTTEDRFAMGQDVCLIRSSSENQRWLNYFLHSKVMSDQLALILVGSTFNRINVADIKALLIAVPPVSEQDRIAAILDREQSKIAVAIGNCLREQALLHEYRTRLIADVVTGKLDVREAAARLPDEEAEPKQFDKAQALIDATDAER